jgi:hypothetical protein
MGAGRKTRRGVMLVERQEQFVRLIAQGVSNSQACRIVGINPRTGTRWRYGRTILNTAGEPVHYPPVRFTAAKPRHPRYLSLEERTSIADLHRAGFGVRSIAQELGRAASTVSRELRRNVDDHGRYFPATAERLTVERQCRSRPRRTGELVRFVEACAARRTGDTRRPPVVQPGRLKLMRHNVDRHDLRWATEQFVGAFAQRFGHRAVEMSSARIVVGERVEYAEAVRAEVDGEPWAGAGFLFNEGKRRAEKLSHRVFCAGLSFEADEQCFGGHLGTPCVVGPGAAARRHGMTVPTSTVSSQPQRRPRAGGSVPVNPRQHLREFGCRTAGLTAVRQLTDSRRRTINRDHKNAVKGDQPVYETGKYRGESNDHSEPTYETRTDPPDPTSRLPTGVSQSTTRRSMLWED